MGGNGLVTLKLPQVYRTSINEQSDMECESNWNVSPISFPDYQGKNNKFRFRLLRYSLFVNVLYIILLLAYNVNLRSSLRSS